MPFTMDTPVRKVGSHVPLRVTISTLHWPSNGAAEAEVTAAAVATAKVVASKVARIGLLNIGPSCWPAGVLRDRWRPSTVAAPLKLTRNSQHGAERTPESLALPSHG